MNNENPTEPETEADETKDDSSAPSENDENIESDVSVSEGDEDLGNFFSDLLQAMRMDDPDYTVHSRYHIHVNHAIDLGDLLIATILALIFIHMFLRDFIRR